MIFFRLIGLFAVFGLAASRAADAYDVAAAAHVIVFGEWPAPAEPGQGVDRSIGQAVDALKQRLATDRAAAATVAAKASRDAFGPAATEPRGGDAALTYAECMRRNLDELSRSTDRYEAAIRSAYPVVIHRDAYAEEIAYWKKHGVVPYYLLLAAIENWARRNQPGLMVTAGTPTISINSAYLATVRVAPAAASEVRTALGLPASGPSIGGADHGQVLAVGGGAMETDGGMYFVAAGR